jgi:bifunctional DNase/RNase
MSGSTEKSSPLVQVELHQIIIREMEHDQYIVLKEVDGLRKLPIMIDSAQAFAIDRRLKGIPTVRPLTHDLLASIIEQLGGSVDQIHITKLEVIEGHGMFFANIRIKQDGRVLEVDSRPSDAIALGVATNVPIFVAEQVMAEASD